MSTLRTFQLWLEPDWDIPQFHSLKWAAVDVSIQDVLLRGVHPWSVSDQYSSLGEAVLEILNGESVQVPELAQSGYCHEVYVCPTYALENHARFSRVLESIRERVCFVDDLAYLELLDIAKETLRARWTHSNVRELACAAHPGFRELRQFLKSKDGTVKLSRGQDVNRYDLAKILTLDDFEDRDQLVISHAIPTLNFRRTSFLEKITDDRGLLRLAPEIRHVTLTETSPKPGDARVVWRVAREGSEWRFRPDLGDGPRERQDARRFAARWRKDGGRLCFTATTENLVEMVESGAVEPSFPTLNYSSEVEPPTAAALVDSSHVRAFHVGKPLRDCANSDHLKDILHRYGVSMSGNKEQLVRKLAALAAVKYRERLPEMDGFFSENRFIRLRGTPSPVAELPLLDDLDGLRNLVLTMYAVKHLRGDAILEASHENNTYNEDELALALLTGKVSLTGAFLRIA